MHVPDPSLPAVMGICVALGAAAIVDLRERRLPNWLTGAIGLTGLLHAALQGGLTAALAALLGTLAGAACLVPQWRYRLVGGGDLKLLAALGAWLGVVRVVYVLLGASVLGGVLALVALARVPAEERRRVRANLVGVALSHDLGVAPPSELSRARGVPYGVAIAAAAAAVLLSGVGS